MTTSARFWDKAARKYAASDIKDVESYQYTLERTRSYLGKDDRVLEIGCGTGSTAILLAPSVREMVATDISPEMIRIAKEKNSEVNNLRFAVAHADDAAADEPFDAVLAHNLLHLVPDVESTLAQIAAQTKSGGVFVSKTPVRPKSFSLLFSGIRLVIAILRTLGKAPAVRFVTATDLDHMIEAHGFRIVETWDQVGTLTAHYVVARKD